MPYKTEASYPLKEWDVITHIGDTPIDNQGMVKLDKDLRVSFGYLDSAPGEGWQAAVDGGSRRQDLQARNCRCRRSIRPWSAICSGSYPPYFIYGPLVFSIATWQMISSIEGNAGMLRCWASSRAR